MKLSTLNERELADKGSCYLVSSEKLTVGVFQFSGRSKTAPHAHPNSEACDYCIAGLGNIEVNGEPHELRPGTAMHVPAGAYHSYQCLSETPFRFIGCIDTQRSFTHPQPCEAMLRKPGLEATVVDPGQGRAVTRDGRTSILLIEPRRVRAKTIGLGYSRYEESSVSGQDHVHADLEQVVYVLSGKGVCEVGTETADVGAGDAVYIPPGVAHRFDAAKPGPLEFLFAYSPPREGWYQAEYPAEQ